MNYEVTVNKRKQIFDFVLALICIISLSPIILICWLMSAIDTKTNGIFSQTRIGLNETSFDIFKFRTMKDVKGIHTTITSSNDQRITRVGRFLRKFKLDELPQLINILKGDMSLVGPRPDVPGYADKLRGEDRILLSVRPGITGPAQIYFRQEEETLARCKDPIKYNNEIIWPMKVKINKEYIENWSFSKDVYYLIKTIF